LAVDGSKKRFFQAKKRQCPGKPRVFRGIGLDLMKVNGDHTVFERKPDQDLIRGSYRFA
jgi:hypothetical protein